jgi:hypothetical protein
MVNFAKSQPEIIPLMESAQKAAEYFRGCSKLYDTVTESRERFKIITITAIPSPEPKKLTLHLDWFEVLQDLYNRRNPKSHGIPITKAKFIAQFGGIKRYEKTPNIGLYATRRNNTPQLLDRTQHESYCPGDLEIRVLYVSYLC